MNKIVLSMLMSMLLLGTAFAGPQIEVSITAEKEITVLEKGKQVTKRVKADAVVQGDVVFYTLSFVNKGDEDALDVALVDPIPAHTLYINGTAYGSGADISFSTDGGKKYQQPSLLTYEVDGKQQVASPDQYTDVRWLIKKLAAGKSGMAGFQVRVQ
ncbi:MAG: hypothetical protein Q9M19_09050 [Mariprofundaceae bacterium]|nr:hypothetical protein [Mariprofundaceae bacterium]